MIKSLLVGLDGSAEADAALELGIDWARRADALLVGLAVVDEPGIHGAEEVWLGEVYFRAIDAQLTADARRAADRVLERAAIRCAEAGVAFKPLEDVGTPHERIVVEAQRFDLIVVGQRTHFRFGWQDAADDTLRRVLRENPRPVVAVPPTPAAAGDAVVVAFDGSVPAARALQAFLCSGLGQGRAVHVVAIAPEKLEAARTADRAVEYLGSHDLKAHPVAIAESGPPAASLCGRLEPLGAGLLVMGAYGKSGLRELFIGSTTKAVLRDCPVPVFLSH